MTEKIELNEREIRLYLRDTFSLSDICIIADFFGCDHENLPQGGKEFLFLQLIDWIRRHQPRDGFRQMVKLVELIELFKTRFDDEEIRTLAFDFGVDLDDIPGGITKPSHIMKFFYWLEKENQFPRLFQWIRLKRPDIDIDSYSTLSSRA